MANHMKEVANILGVDLDEEFEVDYGKGRIVTAKITKCGLQVVKLQIE